MIDNHVTNVLILIIGICIIAVPIQLMLDKPEFALALSVYGAFLTYILRGNRLS